MNHRIIKIHGCSGAGKTTAARAVMLAAVNIDMVEPTPGKPEAYVCSLSGVNEPIVVLGSYKNNCGGMDTVPSAAKAMEMVKFYHSVGHVIHEGLLQSTYYGAMGVDSKQYGDDYIYTFLDTPLIVCLERVVQRRAENNTKNKFNPDLTGDKFNTIAALQLKVERLGHKTAVLKYQEPMLPQILNILGAIQ